MEHHSKKLTNVILAVISLAFFLFLGGCNSLQTPENIKYKHVSVEEATQLMQKPGTVLVDVRGEVSYDSGHIPGAICADIEQLSSDEIQELFPDKSQTIILYCDHGGISKTQAELLAEMGYTNVVEFDGIAVWTGELDTT